MSVTPAQHPSFKKRYTPLEILFSILKVQSGKNKGKLCFEGNCVEISVMVFNAFNGSTICRPITLLSSIIVILLTVYHRLSCFITAICPYTILIILFFPSVIFLNSISALSCIEHDISLLKYLSILRKCL